MNNENVIKWELIEQHGKYYACANAGDSVTTIKKGKINDTEFLLYETHEAYYNNSMKGMMYKVVSSQMIKI